MATLVKHTVKPSGGDYTSLGAAIIGIKTDHGANLVTADVYWEIEIDGDWASADVSGPEFVGLTTDATRYIRFYTTSACRHDGKWNTAKYRLTRADGGVVLTFGTNYIYGDGVQVANTANSDSAHGVTTSDFASTANQIVLSNSIVKGPGTDTATVYGIYNIGANSQLKLYNCIVYGYNAANSNNRSVVNYSSAGVLTVYSSTVVGGYYGIRNADGTVVCKNVYAGGTGSQDFNGTITKTTCASEDATGSVGLTGIALDTNTFVNVSSGTEDFHLAADGNSPLKDVGTDTSGESAPLNFTTDIDGEARSTWDIGADEYVAAAAATNIMLNII